jgi:hypothetical protein
MVVNDAYLLGGNEEDHTKRESDPNEEQTRASALPLSLPAELRMVVGEVYICVPRH